MYRQLGTFAVFVPLMAGAALAQQSPADSPDRAALVAEILSRGEKRVSGAVESARESYSKAKDDSPRDLRIDYAFALVLARQQVYGESLELLGTLQSKSAGNMRLLASRTKIWVLLQQKNYREVLCQVETTSGYLASLSAGAKEGATATETAEFLGRIYAFMELGQPKAVDAAELQRVKALLVRRMPPKLSTAFTRGFDGTKKTYDGLTEAIRTAKENAPKIFEATLKQLDEEKADAEKKSQEPQKQIDQIADDLAAKLRPLEGPERQAEARMRAADVQLAAVKAAADRASNHSGGGRDNSDPFDAAERQAEKEAEMATEHWNAQVRIRTTLENGARAETEKRRKVLRRLTQEIRSCERRRQDMIKGGPDKSADTDSYLRRLGLLATYVTPPFDAEKKRILASYEQ